MITTALCSRSMLTALGVSSLVPACQDEPKACTLAGCVPGMVKIHIPMASSLPIGEPLKLTFCRASECISGEFSLATDANTFRSHGTLTIPEDPSLTLNSDRLDVGVNQHQLQAYANIEITYVPDQQSDLVDGDHYRITITNSYNLKLLDYETTLTYTTYHPNGPQCEPVCRGVEVTL